MPEDPASGVMSSNDVDVRGRPGVGSALVRANDWNDPAWQKTADAWVTARLAALGTPSTGPIERFRVRPWSVTHRTRTAAGPRWFKANVTSCRYEAALADALSRIAPGATLPPLAVDTDRGWLLTADAGPTLREVPSSPEIMLQRYAELQLTVAPHAPGLLALGVPDQRVTRLPALLATTLADPRIRDAVNPAVLTMTTRFGEWCAELAADGLPPTIQHDDLHDGNVFADLRFFDWGDASIAHPFGSLLVAFNVLHDAPAPADLPRLRDAYLEPWSAHADMPTLRRSATLACRVTRLSRALSWQRALHHAALPLDDSHRAAPVAWLDELPADTTI